MIEHWTTVPYFDTCLDAIWSMNQGNCSVDELEIEGPNVGVVKAISHFLVRPMRILPSQKHDSRLRILQHLRR